MLEAWKVRQKGLSNIHVGWSPNDGAGVRMVPPLPQTQQSLLLIDEQELSNKYKIGVLYCKPGDVSEEDLYNNGEWCVVGRCGLQLSMWERWAKVTVVKDTGANQFLYNMETNALL